MALLLFIPGSVVLAQSQNLCNTLPAGAVSGAFEIDGNITSGCSPLTLKLKNKSGTNDVHYLFDYNNQTPLQLDWIGHKDSMDVGFAINSVQSYSILQYGKKNGGEMYACKTVIVKPNNKPVFSYNTCNNNFLNLIIPLVPSNNFDFYEIDFGDGSPILPVQKSQLPFNINKSYSSNNTTRNIRIIGNNTIPTGCPPPPFLTIQMDSDGDLPKITELEVLEGGKTARLTFSGAFDKHQVYQRKISETYAYPNFKIEATPGALTLPLIGNEANCFMIYRNPACVQLSGEACTVKLDTILPLSVTQNNVIWEGINPVINSSIIKNALVQAVLDTLKIETFQNTISSKASFKINSNPYAHNFTDCKLKYCYQIVSIIKGTWGTFPPLPYETRSVSEKKCIDRSLFKPPHLDEITLDINEQNQTLIDFVDNSNWILPIDKYFLTQIYQNDSSKVDSLKNQPLYFEPRELDPSKEEKCFRINFRDVCGSFSSYSPSFCNILLQPEKNDNLSWSNVQPFGNSAIASYEMLEYFDNQNVVGNQFALNKSESSFKIQLDQFETEAKFRLKAISSSGKESHSNIVSIPIEALFYIPDAISIDGNHINDLLEMKGRFGRVKLTTIEIYDRWGSIIYSGTGKEWKPEGNLPAGTYFYKILFSLTDNTYQNKSGKLEVLK
ncbi:MAG: gliding motility-associated C-terminal domain-containing protein [Cytophagaceae bacterium]|nr:gliding motility-associated C-terminal domain-containing protein [Cytophagaceae bacterium]